MIAVIELKGKQHLVEAGQVIRTLRIDGAKGDKVEADRVLATIDNNELQLGKPELKDVKVLLEIVRQARSPKLRIFKYQSKKRTSRRYGYRDNITYLRVKQIKG